MREAMKDLGLYMARCLGVVTGLLLIRWLFK